MRSLPRGEVGGQHFPKNAMAELRPSVTRQFARFLEYIPENKANIHAHPCAIGLTKNINGRPQGGRLILPPTAKFSDFMFRRVRDL